MIEVYLFYLAFLGQIVLLSVIHPRRIIARSHALMRKFPYEEYRNLYIWSPDEAESKTRIYRWINRVIVVIGLVFLAGFVRYMSKPGWDDGPVESLVCLYFFLQLIPIVAVAMAIQKLNGNLQKIVPETTKTAQLQRRSVFDFISPVVVIITALLYPLFVGFVIYINQNPFSGFAGLVNLVAISLLYLWAIALVYFKVYGKKSNPLQSHGEWMFEIGLTVKVAVYSCLFGTVFLGLNFVLVILDQQSLEPLATTIFFVLCALLYLKGMNTPVDSFDMEGYRTS